MKRNRGFHIISNVVLIFVSVLAVVPFWLLLMASITSEKSAVNDGYRLIPKEFSLDAYKYLASRLSTFGTGYLITISVTVIGVVVCILITLMFSYMISRPGLPFGKVLNFFVVFTMLFNGGLVATYIIYTTVFHIKNTLFAYIVPNLLTNAFYIMMVKNYMQSSIPGELYESAKLDGASEFGIFFKIVFPLCKPIIATLGLMVAVAYWNDWQNGVYYIDDQNMYGIQNILNAISSNTKYLMGGGNTASMPSETARMAAAVIAIIPILVVYPFFQDYFVKGITLGAVKG